MTGTKKLLSPLASHPFLYDIMEDLKPLIEEAGKVLKTRIENKKPLKQRPISLTLPYSYYHGVFFYATNLIEIVERLKEIKIFIRSFPNRKTYEKFGISRAKWIRYHYSSFVVSIVSIYDIALILTNTIFQLGMPAKKCTADLIVENAWVKNSKIKPSLLALDKIIKPFREPRHLHVHRGQLPELNQLNDSNLEFVSFAQIHLLKKKIISTKVLNVGYSIAIKNITSATLDPIINECENQIQNFFTDLQPYYKDHCSRLKK